MDLFSLTFIICILCIILLLSLRYLSLLRWFSGQAYVLSKKQESFNILEVLELFKNAKPFPVSYQKGWKIHSFIHGHRVWFHFLTFSRASHSTQSLASNNGASSAPCIKVFATFDRIRASTQSLLQLIKDSSLSCEWKPGVIAARSVHELPSSEVNGRSKGMTSLPVLNDFVRIERVKPSRYYWPWQRNNSANIFTHTVIEDYKRYWHREDNGCSWLLQMNEEDQSLVFFLIQPVEDPDHSLLTVVTWSAPQSTPIIPADESPSVLLSSLSEYIQLRRVKMTPLIHISLPHHLSTTTSPIKIAEKPSAAGPAQQQGSLISRFRQFVDKRSSGNTNKDLTLKPDDSDMIRRSSSILHYRSSSGGLLARSGLASDQPQVIQEENESDSQDSEQSPGDSIQAQAAEKGERGGDKGEGDKEEEAGGGDGKRGELRRAFSEGAARHSPSLQAEVLLPNSEASEKQIARYRTMINQAAADVMAEALRASNIDLETTASVQAEVSSGWIYMSFENNIVILKKVPPHGCTVQSYIGKGFILAPPKIVWDAVRNPRTRFTYDDTLKKVDIVDQVAPGIKIVYLYQEVQQLLRKESCDLCCLQGERVEGSKFVLAYTSLEHPKVPPIEGVMRGKMVSSGWIIEPVHKDKKLYSLVTYLMQVDYGAAKPPSSERLPFEDMMSRHPMSISYLQQYLKPAVQLARRKFMLSCTNKKKSNTTRE
ncbi:uncharacterized protein LOC143281040 [Babylonia areolata]|uniref:uncharacterized protein LOC143281040 n=1 Tax=Babylonia areolata TaxID=304850 RepID=UPI003FD6462D